MSERKVLNKYYPPDFDPTKIPRVKQEKNRQFTVRLMAPFNMRCKTCGEYIYKGKKFNARKEDVENETYYGVRIYRFYIKCTRCLSEISFKTDPASTDYVIEAGATRNFMALKLAEEAALREIEEEKEEERTNPMKLLENRTKASRKEIETVEALEELKELNQRKVAVNYEEILQGFQVAPPVDIRTQELEDEEFIKSVFGEKTEDGKVIKRLADSDSDEDGLSRPVKVAKPSSSTSKPAKATDLLAEPTVSLKVSKSSKFGSLVKIKKAEPVSTPPEPKTDTKPQIKQEVETEIKTEMKTEIEFKTEVKVERNKAVPQTIGLSLLGAYSDSDSNDSS